MITFKQYAEHDPSLHEQIKVESILKYVLSSREIRPLKKMRDDIVIRTRQFARRQVQWFKKEKIDLIVEMDHLNQETTPDVIFDLISGN